MNMVASDPPDFDAELGGGGGWLNWRMGLPRVDLMPRYSNHMHRVLFYSVGDYQPFANLNPLK